MTLIPTIIKEGRQSPSPKVVCVGQLVMANMRSEYVDLLFLETFLHPNSKTVFVFAFQQLEVDSHYFFVIFFVLILLCKIH